MKNTRRIIAAVSALALSLAAVSCGKAEDSSAAPATDSAAAKTESVDTTETSK